MKKTWSDFANSPIYQNLSDEEKKQAQQRYYEKYVYPNVAGTDQAESARESFFREANPTLTDKALDFGAKAVSSVTDYAKRGVSALSNAVSESNTPINFDPTAVAMQRQITKGGSVVSGLDGTPTQPNQAAAESYARAIESNAQPALDQDIVDDKNRLIVDDFKERGWVDNDGKTTSSGMIAKTIAERGVGLGQSVQFTGMPGVSDSNLDNKQNISSLLEQNKRSDENLGTAAWELLHGDKQKAYDYMKENAAAGAVDALISTAGIFFKALRTPTIALQGASEAGNAYRQSIEDGMSEEAAIGRAAFQGITASLTELVGFAGADFLLGKLAKMAPKAQAALYKKALSSAGKAVGTAAAVSFDEGGEEVFNSIANDLADKYGFSKLDMNEQAQQRLANPQILDNASESFVGGALGGAMTSPVAGAGSIAQDVGILKTEEAINRTLNTDRHKLLDDYEISQMRDVAGKINEQKPGAVDVEKIQSEIERRNNLGTLEKASEAGQREAAKQQEAIDASELYGADPNNQVSLSNQGEPNVSNIPSDAATGLVEKAIASESDNVQGSMGTLLSEPAGTGMGESAATSSPSIGTSIPAGTADSGNGALENPFSKSSDNTLRLMKSSSINPINIKLIDEEIARRAAQTNSNSIDELSGEKIDKEWTLFSPESRTLNIPRSEMPQIKSEHRGAMVNFLNARGIKHQQETVPASSLMPTQQEFSEKKVKQAKEYTGGNRSILISSDNHVLDGHHQWLSKLNDGESVDVIRLDAPISKLLEDVKEFPSVQTSNEIESKGTQQKTISETTLTQNQQINAITTISEAKKALTKAQISGNKDAVKAIRAKISELENNVQDGVIARVGVTPRSAEPVTIRNGVIYVGEEPAVNFETGDDVLAQGNTFDDVKRTLSSAGVLSSRQKVFSVAKKAEEPAQNNAKPAESVEAPKEQKPAKPYKPKSLLSVLKDLGGIALSEKQDVTGEQRSFAPGGYNQVFRTASTRSLKGLIESGDLDDYLPYNMRLSTSSMNDDAYDSTEAYDYLADRIRNGEQILPYEVEEEARNNRLYQEQDATADADVELAADLLTEDEINEEFRIAGNSEREAATEAAEFKPESEDGNPISSNGTQESAETNTDQQAEVTAPPTDLLGDDTRNQQALADAERAKDAKRNSGTDNQDTFTLTGSNSEADQAAAAGAQDLFAQPAAQEQDQDEVAKAAEALTEAGVTGKERLDTIKDVRQGNLTADEVAEAYAVNQQAEPAQSTTITDFGEKLEGAKKDLWQNYKKSMSDALPDDLSQITLAKYYPEPDYDNLIASGLEIRAIAAIKAMRDEVPAKPRMAAKVRRWAANLDMLREMASGIIDGKYNIDQVFSMMREKSSLSGFVDRIELYAELGYPAMKSAKGYSVSTGWTDLRGDGRTVSLELPNGRREFYRSREDAVEALRNKLESAPEGTERKTKLDVYKVTRTGEVMIGKKVASNKYIDLKGGFKTGKEAFQYYAENEAQLLELLEQRKTLKPERRSTNNPRVGIDYRLGEDVTPEKFAAEFGFRGVQFGNYVEQSRRARDLNNAYDALLDLANIIGVPPRAISLNGTLGLAFGARGSGGKNAHAAHYERDQVVINLTKVNGFGSLGHEWFHALDNYFSKMRGENEFLTNKPRQNKIYQPGAGFADDTSIRTEVLDAFKNLMDGIRQSPYYTRSAQRDNTRTKDYWSTNEELAARAFEAYLIAKSKESGRGNDYLANIEDEDVYEIANQAARDFGGFEDPYPYPTREEQKTFNPLFDALFATLQSKETETGGIAIYQDKAQYDVYETDLFGNPIQTRSARSGAGKVAPNASANQVSETGFQDTEAPNAEYFVNTIVGTEQNKTLGAAVINSSEQLAQATRYLNKAAVEKLDGVITDINGKPLAVIGGFKGAPTQAAVYPATLVAEAVRVPGAANLWLSHNHPSGEATLSNADKTLYQNLKNVFDGSGISVKSLIAVTKNEYASIDDEGEQALLNIPEAKSFSTVPVIERELQDNGARGGLISSPSIAKVIGKEFYEKAQENGIILSDSQNRIVGWVPLSDKLIGNLKNTGGLNSLYRAISQSNAVGAFIVHNGDLSQPKFENGQSVVENIGRALKNIDVSLLDAINVTDNTAAAEKGDGIIGDVLFSRSQPRTPFVAQQDENYLPTLNNVIALFKSGNRAKQQEAGKTPVPISRTPVVLRQVIEDDGSKPFKRSDFVVGQGSTLYLKADNVHSRSIHSGRISKDVLDRLPQLLADPIAVFKSSPLSEDSKSFKVLLDAADEKGDPVIVAIKPNVPMQQLNNAPVNFQATIFPATWNKVREWNKDGLLRYYNEKSPRTGRPANNPLGTVSELSENTRVGLEASQTSVVPSNPGEAATEVGARESFDANIGVSAAKVKVVTKGDIKNMPEAAFSRSDAPIFYSQLSRAISESKQDSMPAKQWVAWLTANAGKLGIKKDELQWTGVNEWLELQTGKVGKADILAYLDGNGVQVEEVLLADVQTDSYNPSNYNNLPSEMQELVNQVDDGEVDESDFASEAEKLGYKVDLDLEGNVESIYKIGSGYAPTKYAKYTVPGGKNYKELLLTLPAKNQVTESEKAEFEKLNKRFNNEPDFPEKDLAKLNEIRSKLSNEDSEKLYKSSHFDQPNILAHVRFDERTDADGKRVLFIQEVQSDWGQAGKKTGFAKFDVVQNENGEWVFNLGNGTTSTYPAARFNSLKEAKAYAKENGLKSYGVPDAPFVTDTKAWVSLALKRMMRYAADNGFDKVAFITGEQAADLYDLSKQVDRVEYTLNSDGTANINVISPDEFSSLVSKDNQTQDQVADILGKDVAQSIFNDEGMEDESFGDGVKAIMGEGLRVGGEGMRAFYDQIVPQVANDVLKKVGGGKVEPVQIASRNIVNLSEKEAKKLYRKGDPVFFTDDEDSELQVEESDIEDNEEFFSDYQFYTYSNEAARDQVGFTITPEMREKVAAGVPLFKRDASMSGMPTNSVQSVVDALRKNWTAAPEIIVVESMQDSRIPQAVRAENDRQLSQGATGEPEGFYYKGSVYVLSSQMNSAKDVERVVLHETLGHFGLRKTFGKELESILKQLAVSRTKDVKDKAASYGLNPAKESDRLIAAEEVLAEMAQNNPQAGFVKRAIAAIRNWLRKHGFNLQLTDNDIVVNYLLPARAYVEKGGESDVVRALIPAMSRVKSLPDGVTIIRTPFSGGDYNSAAVEAYIDGKRIGRASIYKDKDGYELATIDVNKDYRRKGIATALIKEAQNYVDGNLFTTIHTANGKKLFASLGMKKPSVIPSFSRADQTSTPEFKAWFGDSKVVDADGKPLVVYHGTTSDISIFDPNRTKSSEVIFTTPNQESASNYAETKWDNGAPNVMPLYVSIKTPAYIDASEYSFDKLQSAVSRGNVDGVLVIDDSGKIVIAAPFDAKQIKSAIGNNGNFDPANPDIRFSRRNSQTESPKQGGLLDRVLQIPGRVVAEKITKPAYAAAARLIDSKYLLGSKAGSIIKAGVVADYGLDSQYLERRDEIEARMNQHLRKGKALIQKLGGLSREESRVAYQWLQEKPDTEAEQELMDKLPSDSREYLESIKTMIDGMSKEAIELGQLTPEQYERNRYAYLHRSYAKHEFTDETIENKISQLERLAESTTDAEYRKRLQAEIGNLKLNRKRSSQSSTSRKILGDQYRGRGLQFLVDPNRLDSGSDNNPIEKGQKYIRLERRNDEGVLTKRVWWNSNVPVPPIYADMEQDPEVWEVRGSKDGKILIWRDFTKAERERMGELDEAKFAVASTISKMAHDIEIGKFFEFVNNEYAQDEPPEDAVVVDNAGESAWTKGNLVDALAEGAWVKVPDTKVPTTQVAKYGALSGKYIPGAVWNDIRQIANPPSIWRWYASLQRYWKIAKTALSPAVHLNNVMANFMMADMHDVRASHIVKAIETMWKANGNAEMKAFIERFEDSGAIAGTFVHAELKDDMMKPLLEELRRELIDSQSPSDEMHTIANAISIMFGQREIRKGMNMLSHTTPGKWSRKLPEVMIETYQNEDVLFRLAAFIKAIDEGKNDREAGTIARKAFLDYRINAPWIQGLRQTVLPFVAFTYRMIPMFVETVRDKPWKLAKYMIVANALASIGMALAGIGDDEDEEIQKLLPDDRKGITPFMIDRQIPVGKTKDGRPVYLDVTRWMPLGDIFEIRGEASNTLPIPGFMYPSGVMILASEALSNRSLFSGRDIWQSTDTNAEMSAKLFEHIYKGVAPNIPVLPNTFSWDKISSAISGKTDMRGRQYDVWQALASSFGIKVNTYDVDMLRWQAGMDAQNKIQEIRANINRTSREFGRKGMTEEERNKLSEKERQKLLKVGEEYQEKLN